MIYKSLILRPTRLWRGQNLHLVFDMENRGNVDIDLLFAEVHYPPRILAVNYFFNGHLPARDVEQKMDLMCARYYTTPVTERGFFIPALERTITRSMVHAD